MIRGAMWLLAGVVVTLVAGYLFVKSPQGQRFLGVGPRGPGSGSGIRIVGGSIKVTDVDNWSVEQPDTLHPRTSLEADTADATRFAIEGVSQQRTGKAGTYIYSADPGSTWSVDDLVKDAGRGVRITAHVGATTSNGIVKVIPINNGDAFVPNSGGGAYPNERDYQDNNSQACSPSASPKCDRVDTITVTIGGFTDTWYCVEPNGYCHVDIGSN